MTFFVCARSGSGKHCLPVNEPDEIPASPEARHYRWPLFVLGAVIVFVALAVIWMTVEIRRQQSYRIPSDQGFPQSTNVTK